jgi:alpha-galactosidase
VEVWVKPLEKNQFAVCFLNRGKIATGIDFDWMANPIYDELSARSLDAKTTEYKIRDLWLKKEAGTTKKPLKALIGGHDVLMLKLTP